MRGRSAAIAQAREAELILIDTAGFNPYETDRGAAVARVAERGPSHGSPSVLAAGTRVPDIVVSTSHVWTCPRCDCCLPSWMKRPGMAEFLKPRIGPGIPLSYWGTGQRVPDDLVQAQVNRLGDLLLGGQVRTPGMSRMVSHGSGRPHRQLSPGIKTYTR